MSNMDKKIALALVLTLVIGGWFLVYSLNEPRRMEASSEEFRLRTVAQGEELYAEQCALCHGAEGQGIPQIGSVLNSKTLLTSLDDVALQDVTRDGRPNTAMPAFGAEHGGALNEHQVDQVTAFIRNWESTAPVLPPESQAAQSERPAAGAELYGDTCAICHGENGQGGIGQALNSEYLTAFDDAYLEDAIASGRPQQGMPTWGKVLSPSQIEDLVIFMRDWERPGETTPGAASMPGFAGGVLPLLQEQCAACHSATQQLGGWDSSSYTGVMEGGDNAPAVIPGDPDGSLLVQKLLGIQTIGSQMPITQLLPPEQVQMVIDWILAGAPE